MKRYCKLIISTITMALIFTLIFSPSSYAISKQQFGAWCAAALQALNISFTSAGMTAADAARDFNDYISKPFKIVANQFVDVPYSTPVEGIDQYLSRSVLKIDKDIVTIDGVEYTDVWLSTNAAEKFRVNAFDIENAFDITSQSEGTYVSGAGKLGDVPIFQVGSQLTSQNYDISGTGTYDLGSPADIIITADGTYRYTNAIFPNGQQTFIGQFNTNQWLFKSQVAWYEILNNNRGRINQKTAYSSLDGRNDYTQQSYGTLATPDTFYNAQPFDFDWVSGIIPADHVLTNEGLRIRVPTSDINQWYQDYPDTGPNVTINMGDPELTQKVDDLIDLIIPLIPVLDIDFVDYESPVPQPEPIPEPDPYPDPDPQPGTVIPDLDWSDLFQTIKNIYNKISEHVSISTAIKNILDKIKWFLDDFFGDLGDLLNNLPDIFERHVIDTIRRGLTGLKNIFLPILALLRNALGIWHYVVEWFQAISAPFTFYLSILGQGYPLITIPIYASIAGVIVIAVYRRFGR